MSEKDLSSWKNLRQRGFPICYILLSDHHSATDLENKVCNYSAKNDNGGSIKNIIIVVTLAVVIGGWHWMLTQSAERDLMTKHCQYETSVAMQMYDRIKAGDFQQANDVWEQNVYQNIVNAIRQGKLSTAVKEELFLRCMGEYV